MFMANVQPLILIYSGGLGGMGACSTYGANFDSSPASQPSRYPMGDLMMVEHYYTIW